MNSVERETPAQLKLLYPDLKHIRTKVKLEFPNCDAHLLRIPSSVDPLLLLNKDIILEEKCKIKLDEKYIFKATKILPDPTFIVSDHSKILNLRKNFILRKHVKAKKHREISISEKSVVKLPENLKARHPLFGPRFEDKIHLSKEVENKLDEAIASVIKRKTKKKKLWKIKHKQEDDHQNEVIYNLLNVQNISAPKIKTEVSDDSAFSSCRYETDLERKKRKKEKKEIKHKQEDDHQNEVIYNLLNVQNISAPKIKTEVSDDSAFSSCSRYETDLERKKRKKEKKDKKEKSIEQEVDIAILEVIKQDIMDSLTATKHKNNSIASSTLMSEASSIPSFSPNLSFITPSTSDAEKKKKKSKRKRTVSEGHAIENGIMTDILDDIKSELFITPTSAAVKKKKKSKRKRTVSEGHAIESGIMTDILDDIKSELSLSKKVKKKRIEV